MHGGGIPPGGVATGDENDRPSGKPCQWLLRRGFENAWAGKIAPDFRGRSLMKRTSRESTRKTRIQFGFVFIRENPRLMLSRYLQPLEGVTGHAPIAVVTMVTGATSCVKSIKGPQ